MGKGWSPQVRLIRPISALRALTQAHSGDLHSSPSSWSSLGFGGEGRDLWDLVMISATLEWVLGRLAPTLTVGIAIRTWETCTGFSCCFSHGWATYTRQAFKTPSRCIIMVHVNWDSAPLNAKYVIIWTRKKLVLVKLGATAVEGNQGPA